MFCSAPHICTRACVTYVNFTFLYSGKLRIPPTHQANIQYTQALCYLSLLSFKYMFCILIFTPILIVILCETKRDKQHSAVFLLQLTSLLRPNFMLFYAYPVIACTIKNLHTFWIALIHFICACGCVWVGGVFEVFFLHLHLHNSVCKANWKDGLLVCSCEHSQMS